MTAAKARIGDVTDHGGVIVSGSTDSYTNGNAVARVGDVVLCPLHGQTVIVSGSTTHFTNGNADARIGDVTSCGATIVSGSVDRYVGETPPTAEPPPAIPDFQPGVTPREAFVGSAEEPGAMPPRIRALQEEAKMPENTLPPATPDTTPPPTPPASVPKDCGVIHTMTEFPPSFMLTANFSLGSVSSQTLLQKATPVAQQGLTLQQIVCNLKTAAQNLLEPLSTKYGRPMITSGFRPQSAGISGSKHTYGCAFDLQWSGISDDEYYARAVWARDNLSCTQVILEFGGNRPWLHVAYKEGDSRYIATRTKVPSTYTTGLVKCTNVPGQGGRPV